MTRGQRARALFLQGYNCSQAVLGAFDDVMGLTFEQAMRLASPFGGGIARLRQVCGACTAMLMVCGTQKGYTEPDVKAKSEHYAFVREMTDAYESRCGSIVCRELLALRSKKSENADNVDNGTSVQANERSAEYYRVRPCASIVEEAACLACEKLGIDPKYPNEKTPQV